MRHQVAARLCVPPLVVFALLGGGTASRVLAAGVVGTGSPASCTQTALETALAGGGLVTFNCGPSLKTISLVTGTGETIGADTTVDGGGLITIDSTTIDSDVFNVDAGAMLTLENLTLVNTNTSAPVIPVINNQGAVVATNCTFSDTVYAAILTVPLCPLGPPSCVPGSGVVTATNCTFNGAGGGLSELGLTVPGPSVVSGCTFSNSTRPAIFTHGALAVTNSTFTGNQVGVDGVSAGPVVITNSTFSHNQTALAGAVTLTNTIVAGSSVANCSGTITDGGHNLDDGSSCAFSAPGSLSSTPADLDSAGLQNNGGPTQTIALLDTSAAVDGGDDAVCAATSGTAPVRGVDQRGFVRPGAGHTHCSMGAYELSFAPTPTPTPEEAGLIPPDKATLACEDGVAKNLRMFESCIRACHIKAAHAAFKAKMFDEEACENTDPAKSCRAKYDATAAVLVAGTCPTCLGAAQQSALADQVKTQLDTGNRALYCAGTVALGGDDSGLVPPDKGTLACEAGVAKSTRTLAGCLDTCHVKAAKAAFKNNAFDEEACESTDPKSCLAKYNVTAGQLVAGGACPSCLSIASQTTLGAQTETSEDGLVEQIYCAGTTPLP